MSNKTERILSYLPGTFHPSFRRSALQAFVGTFGSELLSAENSLAAVMQAHWVDHADRGTKELDDLICLASLYGLGPRDYEGVEEFREHLKRYIRTFLEGSVTVQGILRTAAESLGIRIADDYEDLDTWWSHGDYYERVTIMPRGDDAAELIFGKKEVRASGSPASRASIRGAVDLSGGVDLRGASRLKIKVDTDAPVDIDLDDKNDLSSVNLVRLEKAINNKLTKIIASPDGPYLVLASPLSGPGSRLEILNTDANDDAANRILGLAPSVYRGSEASPAEVIGIPDLNGGIDLSNDRYLRLVIDGNHIAEIDCGSSDPGKRTPGQICDAINSALGTNLARSENNHIRLTSTTMGSGSTISFGKPAAQDATKCLFGDVSNFYKGLNARSAEVTGTLDLSTGADLSKVSNIRLKINGIGMSINCAGEDPAHTNLDEIAKAINQAFGFKPASHNGSIIKLTSPTVGSTSEIVLEVPAEGDATENIFGIPQRIFTGHEASEARITSESGLRAEMTGVRDLSKGVDLSKGSNIKLKINGLENPKPINCAGKDPANTNLDEIVTAINQAFGFKPACHNGTFIKLMSPTTGPSSDIALVAPTEGNATENIFGDPILSRVIDLRACRWLNLGVDGKSPVEIDLPAKILSLEDLTKAINTASGLDIASHDGTHLILTSQRSGASSSIAIEPMESTQQRRFVTRAAIIDDAAQSIFGFIKRDAVGEPALNARITGKVDLRSGVDLRDNRYLRLAVDGHTAVDIDCAVPRPRAKSIGDIMDAINNGLGSNSKVATHDGRHLILTSPSAGAGSQIAFEQPRATDALDTILGIEPGVYKGKSPTGVRFVGTVNLGKGVGLEAGAAIKLGIDGASPVEIVISEDAGQKYNDQIVTAINTKLGISIASLDGEQISLKSSLTGSSSRISFEMPDGPDATRTVFGISPPRAYQGVDASPARIIGIRDLFGTTINLTRARYLRLRVDESEMLDVDCGSTANDPASSNLGDVVKSINENPALKALGTIASDDGSHLILTSPKTGSSSQIVLEHNTLGDARTLLLGEVDNIIRGKDPKPAMIEGMVDLLGPVNLGQRSVLRLEIDGGRPVDIDVAGAAPEMTSLDEIEAAINSALKSNIAGHTDDSRIKITSPTAGEESRISIQPLRYLELIEYPPKETKWPDKAPRDVRHGESWSIDNSGAADVFAEVQINAPHGVAGPVLVNETLGWQLRLLAVMGAGETAVIKHDAMHGLNAEICSLDGTRNPVPAGKIMAGPAGSQVSVPFKGDHFLTGTDDQGSQIQLNNPLASKLVILQALTPGSGQKLAVSVTETDLTSIGSGYTTDDKGPIDIRLLGRLHADGLDFRLDDIKDVLIAHLRAGVGAELEAHLGRAVAVTGRICKEDNVMIAREVADLFDVKISGPDGTAKETYQGVTIGVGSDPGSLIRWINAGSDLVNDAGSNLVKAEELDKGLVLRLPRGRSDWGYMDCRSARFNQAKFNKAHYAGGRCYSRGIFDISSFSPQESKKQRSADHEHSDRGSLDHDSIVSVFASSGQDVDPPVGITFVWTSYLPGAFVVNLPADLPARFGARFNEARFGQRPGDGGEPKAEVYTGVVAEPNDDPDYIVDRINGTKDPKAASKLVRANRVDRVPLGWEAVRMPFREPRFLTKGRKDVNACIYLAVDQFKGYINISAQETGKYGNEIAVTARQAGVGMYDVSIIYGGARFENACSVVRGDGKGIGQRTCKKAKQEVGGKATQDDGLPALIKDLLKPGTIGILQAKAAGTSADVTRNRT